MQVFITWLSAAHYGCGLHRIALAQKSSVAAKMNVLLNRKSTGLHLLCFINKHPLARPQHWHELSLRNSASVVSPYIYLVALGKPMDVSSVGRTNQEEKLDLQLFLDSLILPLRCVSLLCSNLLFKLIILFSKYIWIVVCPDLSLHLEENCFQERFTEICPFGDCLREDRKKVYFKLLKFLDALLAFKRIFFFLLSNVILTID